jgi:hypothetical protein
MREELEHATLLHAQAPPLPIIQLPQRLHQSQVPQLFAAGAQQHFQPLEVHLGVVQVFNGMQVVVDQDLHWVVVHR